METPTIKKEAALRYDSEDPEIAKVLGFQEEALKQLRLKDPVVYCIETYDKKEALIRTLEGELQNAQYNESTGHDIAEDIEKFRKYVQENPPTPREVEAGMKASQRSLKVIEIYSRACSAQGAVSSAIINVLKTLQEQQAELREKKAVLDNSRAAFEKEKQFETQTLALDKKHYEELETLLLSEPSRKAISGYYALLRKITDEKKVHDHAKQLIAETAIKAPLPSTSKPIQPKSEEPVEEEPEDLLEGI